MCHVCAHVCVTLAFKRIHTCTHTMRYVMLRAKHGIHVNITYMPPPHHCLPRETWCNCPVQHPTCECTASVRCLAHRACVSSCVIHPTTLAREHLLLYFVINMMSLLVRRQCTVPLQRRNFVLDVINDVHSTSPIFTSLTLTLPISAHTKRRTRTLPPNPKNKSPPPPPPPTNTHEI